MYIVYRYVRMCMLSCKDTVIFDPQFVPIKLRVFSRVALGYNDHRHKKCLKRLDLTGICK